MDEWSAYGTCFTDTSTRRLPMQLTDTDTGTIPHCLARYAGKLDTERDIVRTLGGRLERYTKRAYTQTIMETIQAYVTFIKDIITGLAAAIAAVVAINGLQTWKKQLKGKTEYELAQRLLRSTYKVRDAFVNFRYWQVTDNEEFQATKGENIEYDLEDSKRYNDIQRAVYSIRWQKIQEAFIDLDSVALEAEAIWGPTVREYVTDLRNYATILQHNLEIYLEWKSRMLEQLHPMTDDDRAVLRIMHEMPGDKENFFSKAIASAVSKIENFLKPHLKL